MICLHTYLRILTATLLTSLFLCACQQPTADTGQLRAAYYWSTTFTMDSVQTAFLQTHHISRLYLRYFDVVMGPDGKARPNATVRFVDAAPAGVDIVPVVFIMNDCMAGDTGNMAERIVKRILQMNETHDRGTVSEIQIDCDWTASTEARFFAFLDDMRNALQPHGIALSATIRLHQLRTAVPPVDRGVLMMYNTGNMTRLDDHHPILSLQVARPYLQSLADYDLPLSTAYPLFRWELLFRGQQFVGILHGDNLPRMAGDSIVVREPSLDEILEARRLIGQLRPDANHEVILYELSDYYTITRFNTEDYETIFAD